MDLHIKEEKLGNFKNVAELIDFKILKFAPQGLLGIGKADVMLLYKKQPGETNKEQKRLIIYGPEDAVYQTALNKISQKKNPAKANQLQERFKHEWKNTDYETTSPQPSTLFKHKLFNLGLNAKRFSELSGVPAGSVYHHTSGGREISRETAIEYADKLGCDPVDLMFDKKVVPIWSKVNLLKRVELDDYYAPGRLYSYTIVKETDTVEYAHIEGEEHRTQPLEKVVVPRDIYREDIKAIKVEARGSMYHNKVLFYYRASDKTGDYLNQLCVVGIDVEVMPDVHDTHYYFGLYEEIRGQSNLVNPDPFVSQESKFILKNFNPKFIAPIVATLNPTAVVDQTKLKKSIPASALVNKEEELKMQLNQKHAEIGNLKKKLEDTEAAANNMAKKSKSISDANLKVAQELGKAQRKAEEEVNILLHKVNEITERINKDMIEKTKTNFLPPLFDKEQKIMNKIKNDLRIVRGGKK
jgi:hypothetical protein